MNLFEKEVVMLIGVIVYLVIAAMLCLSAAACIDTILYAGPYPTPERRTRNAITRLIFLELAIVFGALATIFIVVAIVPSEPRNSQSDSDLEMDAVYQLVSQSEVDGKYYAVMKKREDSEPALYKLDRLLPDEIKYFIVVEERGKKEPRPYLMHPLQSPNDG